MPKISICIPTHNMKDKDYFLSRCTNSINRQTFTDYEVIITDEGRMAENTNAAIKKAKGEIIKILFMDDYFASDFSLQHIVENFKSGWLATGCIHNDRKHLFNPHYPEWNVDVSKGINTIGSPSVIAFENNDPLLFDENLTWVLDCEFYDRLYKRYGPPRLLSLVDIVIGVGDHQTTHLLTEEEKDNEVKYVINKQL